MAAIAQKGFQDVVHFEQSAVRQPGNNETDRGGTENGRKSALALAQRLLGTLAQYGIGNHFADELNSGDDLRLPIEVPLQEVKGDMPDYLGPNPQRYTHQGLDVVRATVLPVLDCFAGEIVGNALR